MDELQKGLKSLGQEFAGKMEDGDVFVNVSEKIILEGMRKAKQILPIKDNVEQ
jgi:hypothetical protein